MTYGNLNILLAALVVSMSIAGYPLLASVSLLAGLPNEIYSIALRGSVSAISSFILILAAIKGKVLPRRALVFPVFLFWFLYLLRIAHDTSFGADSLSRDPSMYWLQGVLGGFLPFLALTILSVPNSTLRIKNFLYVLLTLAVLLAYLCLYMGLVGSSVRGYEIDRLEFEYLGPISLGHLGCSMFLLGLDSVLIQSKSAWVSEKLLSSFFMIAAGLGLLVLAASRGPMVAGLVATMSLTVALVGFRKGLKAILIFFTIAAGVYLAAEYINTNTSYKPVDRMVALFELNQGSAKIRIDSVGAAWSQFLGSPIFGSGLEEATTQSYPHNVIVEAFMATGVLGGVSFLFICGWGYAKSLRLLRMRDTNSWIALLFIQYLVAAQFSGSLWSSSTFWVLLGFLLSAHSSGAKSLPVSSHNQNILPNLPREF